MLSRSEILSRREALSRFGRASLLLAGSGGALGALSTVGCRVDEDSGSGPVTVRFWNGWTGPDGAKALAIVRAFNAENPDIQVKMQRIDWGTYYNKLFVAGIAGRAPELFVLHTSSLRRFAEAKFILPVDEFVQRDNFPISDIDANVWQGTNIDGKHYGLPIDIHMLGAFVNMGLLQKAGFSKPPTTREEFLAILKATTDPSVPDGGQWGFAFAAAPETALTMISQFGGQIFNEDYSKCILVSKENIEAMQFCVDLIRKDKVAPPPEGGDPWVSFRQGRVGMTWAGIFMLPDLEKQADLKFIGAPIPKVGRELSAWASSHNFCLKSGMGERRTEAAWKFTKYYSEHSVKWAAAGQVPVRKSIRESSEFKALPVQSAFAQEIPWGKYQPQVSFTFEFQTAFNYMVEKVLRGTAPPLDALREAEDAINKIITRRESELLRARGERISV